ncbi:hypothetical protein ACHAW6_010950 [Cyclotella cf. meneghiniana]
MSIFFMRQRFKTQMLLSDLYHLKGNRSTHRTFCRVTPLTSRITHQPPAITHHPSLRITSRNMSYHYCTPCDDAFASLECLAVSGLMAMANSDWIVEEDVITACCDLLSDASSASSNQSVTEEDIIDIASPSFTLYDPADEGRINDAHTIIRRDVCEGFVVTNHHEGLQNRLGTVVFRCRFCKHLPRSSRGQQSEFMPFAIEGLYRAQMRFQKNHFPYCKHTPEELKAKHRRAHDSKGNGRGCKSYWVDSALKKGLRNSSKGIVYCGPPFVCD